MKKPINEAVSTCANPLRLRWEETTHQYKVNKPQDQSGLYVSKHIADNLLKELVDMKNRMRAHDTEFNIPSLNEAIANAEQK